MNYKKLKAQKGNILETEKEYPIEQEDALSRYLNKIKEQSTSQPISQNDSKSKKLWIQRGKIIACCVVLLLAGIASISMLKTQEEV